MDNAKAGKVENWSRMRAKTGRLAREGRAREFEGLF